MFQGCGYKQADILHLEILARRVHSEGQDFVFYDRNATKDYSQAYTDPMRLKDVVDWALLTEMPQLDGFCKYFHDKHEPAKYMDRMEKRQAEFLVKDAVPLAWFTRIGVMSDDSGGQALHLLKLTHQVVIK